jgi:phasin
MFAMSANADFPKTTEATQAFREVAEKGAAEVKENFEKMAAAAGEATHVLKDTHATGLKGAQDYSAKVFEIVPININSAFEYVSLLATVKSPTEFFSLSENHLRQQFERLSRQAQELAAIAQKMMTATAESVETGIHKAG